MGLREDRRRYGVGGVTGDCRRDVGVEVEGNGHGGVAEPF